MAQANCLVKIPPIGRNQPPVIAWSDWRGGCNGAQAVYPVPISRNLCQNSDMGIGANDIDAIYVPPNVEVTVDYHCDRQENPVRFDGNNFLGQGINYPGLYQMDSDQGQKFITDLYGNGNRISSNDIDVIHTYTKIPWDEHLNKCCKGEIQDPRKCGNFVAGNRECREFLSKCTAEDLKKNPGCQEMCRKDPVHCDQIKYAYCQKNPEDPWCSCMNVEKNEDYRKFANRVIEKTGQVPRIGCSPFGRCNTGVDLLDIFLPSTILSDRETPCQSYANYLDQSVTTAGNNNVVTTNLAASIVATPPPPPVRAPPKTSTPTSTAPPSKPPNVVGIPPYTSGVPSYANIVGQADTNEDDHPPGDSAPPATEDNKTKIFIFILLLVVVLATGYYFFFSSNGEQASSNYPYDFAQNQPNYSFNQPTYQPNYPQNQPTYQ